MQQVCISVRYQFGPRYTVKVKGGGEQEIDHLINIMEALQRTYFEAAYPSEDGRQYAVDLNDEAQHQLRNLNQADRERTVRGWVVEAYGPGAISTRRPRRR